jgi:hypothetical protein
MHKSLRSVRCSATEHRDALVSWLQFIIENLTRLAHCSRFEATIFANASIPLSVRPLQPPICNVARRVHFVDTATRALSVSLVAEQEARRCVRLVALPSVEEGACVQDWVLQIGK